MSSLGNEIWAAVSIKPNQIKKAEANLTQQGFIYLAPKIKVTRRNKNRFIQKTELLFPGYLFVHIDKNGCDSQKVNSTYGVSNILKVGNKIGIIPDAFINALQEDTFLKNTPHKKGLRPGQHVEIIKGPFTGLIGKLAQVDCGNRVKCLFNLISGNITASVLLEDIIAYD